VQNIGAFIVHVLDGMLDIQAKCNNAKIDTKSLDLILPHHLVHLCGCEFVVIVIKHCLRLLMFWDV
jgi:hypothetical protein